MIRVTLNTCTCIMYLATAATKMCHALPNETISSTTIVDDTTLPFDSEVLRDVSIFIDICCHRFNKDAVLQSCQEISSKKKVVQSNVCANHTVCVPLRENVVAINDINTTNINSFVLNIQNKSKRKEKINGSQNHFKKKVVPFKYL